MRKLNNTEIKEFKEIIFNDSMIEECVEYVASNFDPEEVYGREILEEWAYSNGFTGIEDED